MKFLKSNWREAVAIVAILLVLIVGLLSLGSREVSESGPLSTCVSLAVSLIGGVVKFVVCLGLAWAGLSITLPEAGQFTFGRCFDVWWTHELTQRQKGFISVIAAAVLGIIAALCMASS